MAKLKSSFINMLLSLSVISVVSAGLLAAVNSVTQEPILKAEKNKQDMAIKMVAPEYNNKPTEESFDVEIGGGDKLKVFPAKMNGKFVGAAIETNTKKGFGGEIKIMIGLDENGTIKNFSVLKHAETPGLGSKMQEWFSDPSKNVIGQMANGKMAVKKDGGDVDAITAATITSRAFADAMNRAYEAFLKCKNMEENGKSKNGTEKTDKQ